MDLKYILERIVIDRKNKGREVKILTDQICIDDENNGSLIKAKLEYAIYKGYKLLKEYKNVELELFQSNAEIEDNILYIYLVYYHDKKVNKKAF